MKYYKVVNSITHPVIIDTTIINYNLTLIHKNKFASLMDFFTNSSLELNLPLNFFYYLYNNIANSGELYLRSFGLPVNNLYELYNLTYRSEHKGIYIHKNELIKIIIGFDQIGYEHFDQGNYLWEFIYEKVRVENHPSQPDRGESFFLFDNKKDCQYYIEKHKGGGQICEVELIDTMALFKGDMNMLDIIPESFTAQQAQDNAEKYWRSQTTENPVFEYLFQGRCILKM